MAAELRRAVADLLALARRHPARLPIFRDPRANIAADRLFVHVRSEDEQRPRAPDAPTIVATVTSLDMSIFHHQIEFSGGLYVSLYKGDLFVNQLSQISGSPYDRFARQQIWMQWSARAGRYRMRHSGASLALLDKIFAGRTDLDIYRVGYPEEPRLFAALTRPARRARAIETLLPHLDPSSFDNHTFYGPGRMHGYYFTSDAARVRYHLKKTEAVLYRVRVELREMQRLVREEKLFVALEWVDEINLFSVDALRYIGGRCRRVSASSRPPASSPSP